MPDAIEVGAEVVASDGDKLGTVKEVYGDWFKIDAKFAMDYWLAVEHVASATPETVTVSFAKDLLPDLKADYPGDPLAAPGPTPEEAGTPTPLSDAAAQLEIGEAIYTRDGEHIGEVREVRGAHFRVNAPMSLDYWLAADLVSQAGELTGLTVTQEELGAYKLERHPDDVPMPAGEQSG